MANERVDQYDSMDNIETCLICYLDTVKILK